MNIDHAACEFLTTGKMPPNAVKVADDGTGNQLYIATTHNDDQYTQVFFLKNNTQAGPPRRVKIQTEDLKDSFGNKISFADYLLGGGAHQPLKVIEENPEFKLPAPEQSQDSFLIEDVNPVDPQTDQVSNTDKTTPTPQEANAAMQKILAKQQARKEFGRASSTTTEDFVRNANEQCLSNHLVYDPQQIPSTCRRLKKKERRKLDGETYDQIRQRLERKYQEEGGPSNINFEDFAFRQFNYYASGNYRNFLKKTFGKAWDEFILFLDEAIKIDAPLARYLRNIKVGGYKSKRDHWFISRVSTFGLTSDAYGSSKDKWSFIELIKSLAQPIREEKQKEAAAKEEQRKTEEKKAADAKAKEQEDQRLAKEERDRKEKEAAAAQKTAEFHAKINHALRGAVKVAKREVPKIVHSVLKEIKDFGAHARQKAEAEVVQQSIQKEAPKPVIEMEKVPDPPTVVAPAVEAAPVEASAIATPVIAAPAGALTNSNAEGATAPPTSEEEIKKAFAKFSAELSKFEHDPQEQEKLRQLFADFDGEIIPLPFQPETPAVVTPAKDDPQKTAAIANAIAQDAVPTSPPKVPIVVNAATPEEAVPVAKEGDSAAVKNSSALPKAAVTEKSIPSGQQNQQPVVVQQKQQIRQPTEAPPGKGKTPAAGKAHQSVHQAKAQDPKAIKKQEAPPQPTFATKVGRVFKDAAIKGAGAFVGTLIKSIFTPPQSLPAFTSPQSLSFGSPTAAPNTYQYSDPIAQKCFAGEFMGSHQGSPLSQLFGISSGHDETDFDAILRGERSSSNPREQSPFPQSYAGRQQDSAFTFFDPTHMHDEAPAPTSLSEPLSFASPFQTVSEGGIVQDQQPWCAEEKSEQRPSALSAPSSSLSSSCSPSAPLHPMDISASTQDGGRISLGDIKQTRLQSMHLMSQAIDLTEGTKYEPLVNNACDTVEALDKIAEILVDTRNTDLAYECVHYAEACAQATHCMAEIAKGTRQGFGDTAQDGVHAATHPIETGKSILEAHLAFGQLLVELTKLCVDPSLSGHRLETAQHMASALGHAIEEKVDHMRHATLQQNAREVTHLASGFVAANKAQGLAAGQLKKLVKYIARIKKIVEAEKPVAAAAGAVPIIENALEKAAPKAATQIEKGTASEVAQAAERSAVVAAEEKAVEVAETAAESAAKTGTVWDSIKMTDPMLSGTKIPKSFVLTTKGNQQFWVTPNATKHMADYVIEARATTHGMPINNQTLLTSFKAAVDKAVEQGIVYNKEYTIGCWELVFSESRGEGLLPAIKHALYKPQGF
jgi:hypothetical protein